VYEPSGACWSARAILLVDAGRGGGPQVPAVHQRAAAFGQAVHSSTRAARPWVDRGDSAQRRADLDHVWTGCFA
jgi:hypothetical protein